MRNPAKHLDFRPDYVAQLFHGAATLFDTRIKDLRRWLVLLATLVLCLGFVGQARAAKSSDLSINVSVNGSTRTALAHVPSPMPTGPVALVLAYHGHGGDNDSMVSLTNFNAEADANGFIVVYPEALNRHWTRGDVAFTKALLAQLNSQYTIDPKRVYATGMSAGALFSEGLGVSMADTFAAIAPVAGPLQTRFANAGLAGTPISVIEFHGDSDPIIPFTGGSVKSDPSISVVGAQDSAKAWAALDGCSAVKTSHVADGTGRDKTSVNLEDYGTGTSGCAVELYVIRGGGHAWPGGQPYLRKSEIGATSKAVNATDLIWQFFKAHPKQ